MPEIREVRQRIVEIFTLEDVALEPPHVESLFTTNRVQRAFAHLFLDSPQGPVRAEATADGEQKVADTALRDYCEYPVSIEAFDGTQGDSYKSYQDFTTTSRITTVVAEDYGLWVQFKDADGVEQDAVYVPADSARTIETPVSSFRLKSASAGNTATWYVDGQCLGA